MKGDIITEYVDGKIFTFPKILYKYRDWDNDYHKTILLENKIFLSAPRDFEDEMDCNIPEKFPSKEELYDLFLEKSKQENLTYTRQEHRALARHWLKKITIGKSKKIV